VKRRFNVLISSAGRRHALLEIFRRALGELGLDGEVMAGDMSRLSAAFQAADRAFLVPRCTSAEFVPRMLEICRENEIALVIPTIDTELPVYAAHRDAFAKIGTTVTVSRPEVVAIGGDKARTHAWLVAHGFPTVRQAAVEEALAAPEAWPYPFLVKPSGGSSSIGVAVVRDRTQLEAATRGGGFIAQTLATGVEHTIDFLASREGKCLCAVPRRRFEVRAGEVSKGMTVRSPALEGLASRLCEALPGAYGCLNVQVFLDEATGTMNVIEINPRFGGGFPLSWEAGARYPRWIIEELLGLPSTATATSWRDRLVMLRYDDAVFVDAAKAGV
jgi:carbamoyl-phosphate synthase large subunit